MPYSPDFFADSYRDPEEFSDLLGGDIPLERQHPVNVVDVDVGVLEVLALAPEYSDRPG